MTARNDLPSANQIVLTSAFARLKVGEVVNIAKYHGNSIRVAARNLRITVVVEKVPGGRDVKRIA